MVGAITRFLLCCRFCGLRGAVLVVKWFLLLFVAISVVIGFFLLCSIHCSLERGFRWRRSVRVRRNLLDYFFAVRVDRFVLSFYASLFLFFVFYIFPLHIFICFRSDANFFGGHPIPVSHSLKLILWGGVGVGVEVAC